jgi:hypothetical protein
VSLEQTQQIINRYFDLMGHRGDFAKCYRADVTCTTDTGRQVRGPSSVRDYIVALHNNMFDAQTRRIVVSDGHAYLEGDCVQAPSGANSRIYYCVAYDIVVRIAFTRVDQGRQWFSWPGSWVERRRRLPTPAGTGRPHKFGAGWGLG